MPQQFRASASHPLIRSGPLWPLIAAALIVTAFAAEPPSDKLSREAAGRLFRDEVLPVLKDRCFGCHGDAAELEGGLDLRTRAAMVKGGESGEPSLVPGEPERSPLYQAVLRTGELIMPPKERNKLSENETAALRRWIAAGAPWPEATATTAKTDWNSQEGIEMSTSGGLSDQWTHRRYQPQDVWAFFPIKKHAVPAKKLFQNPLPRPRGRGQGEGADREDQPPHPRPLSPEDGGEGSSEIASKPTNCDPWAYTNNPIDAFVAEKLAETHLNPAPPADRRTWLRRATLDLTGLPPTADELDAFETDTAPEAVERVIERLLRSPHYGERMAQHWLDVVRYADTGGFSNDYERPNAWRYRDYVIRAFNADKPYDRFVLEQIAGDELEPDNPELRVAVGFLRMGPWEHTGMSVAALTRQMFLDDVTNSVGVTFLGLGLNCCRCHDHKFDPLPTRDYYSLQAVFASTQFDEPNTPFLPDENTTALAAGRARIDLLAEDRDWYQTDDPDNDSARRINKKRDEYLQRARQRYEPKSFSVKNAEPEPIHILLGGSLEAPADEVAPGVLSAVQPVSYPIVSQSRFSSVSDGRRLALAQWIASRDNPLTARVIVNRVWQMHFGTGLVATPNNFGKMGRRPSHPELLDWLALWFMDHDWSLKQLHRLLMTSAAYQRSSSHPEMDAVNQADPRNELLAYFPPRRLTAEEIRDAMLAATGELSTTLGGPGVFPEINWEVAMQPRHIMGSIAPAYQPSPRREERNRRTIYAFRYRTLSDPMLDVFNRPGTEASCERRDETTVTPQVFALFNGQSVHDRALALAHRLEQMTDDPQEQVNQAFRILYGRLPSNEQRDVCLNHLSAMTEHDRHHQPPRIERSVWVPREMIDEQTGLPFRWLEKLHNLLDYEPAPQSADAAPEIRALAELCLVLLNSNEFLYVY